MLKRFIGYKYSCFLGVIASIMAISALSSFNGVEKENTILNSSLEKILSPDQIKVENLCRAKKRTGRNQFKDSITVGGVIKVLENTIPNDSQAIMTFRQTIGDRLVGSLSVPLAKSLFPTGLDLFPKSSQIKNSLLENAMSITISIPDPGASVTVQFLGEMKIKSPRGKKLENFKELATLTFTGPTNMTIELNSCSVLNPCR